MIVDVQTWLWHTPAQLGSEFAQQLSATQKLPWERPLGTSQVHALDAAGQVDVSLVLGLRADAIGAHLPAEDVARWVRDDPSHRIGLAGIDPSATDWRAQCEQARALDLRGVVISPAAQGVHPGFAVCHALASFCVHAGWPLVVYPGAHLSHRAVLSYAQPILLDDLARAFPQLRLLLLDAGSHFPDQALLLARHHRHVYLACADLLSQPWGHWHWMRRAVEMGVAHKLLFASGFPLHSVSAALHAWRRLSQSAGVNSALQIPRAALDAVLERDALACLGLKPPPASATPPRAALTTGVDPI